MKKVLLLCLQLILASVIVWILFWKFQGQDLNLFARQVLPMPITGTLVLTGVFSGLITGVYRLVKGKWMAQYHRLTWVIWLLFTAGLLVLITTTTG